MLMLSNQLMWSNQFLLWGLRGPVEVKPQPAATKLAAPIAKMARRDVGVARLNGSCVGRLNVISAPFVRFESRGGPF